MFTVVMVYLVYGFLQFRSFECFFYCRDAVEDPVKRFLCCAILENPGFSELRGERFTRLHLECRELFPRQDDWSEIK